LFKKQKTAKGTLGWLDRVAGDTGRAKLLTWGLHIFAFNLRIFIPAPNLLSFAPRLNL